MKLEKGLHYARKSDYPTTSGDVDLVDYQLLLEMKMMMFNQFWNTPFAISEFYRARILKEDNDIVYLLCCLINIDIIITRLYHLLFYIFVQTYNLKYIYQFQDE